MSAYVRAQELADALGISRKTLDRWIVKGKVSAPVREPGEWRRWPLASAVEVLSARGCPVPATWSIAAVAA